MSAVWLWAMFNSPSFCFFILHEDENNTYLRGLLLEFNEMEHLELCAWCLLAYLVVSLANRMKLHPIHFFVGSG